MQKAICSAVILMILTCICMLPGTGCAGENSLVISGTLDILSPLERKILPLAQYHSGISMYSNYSARKIEDLKRGRCDILFAGRELEPDELKGLTDNVVAYDAVCILIDNNSYSGGERWVRDSSGWTPRQKSGGIRELSTGELREIFSFDLRTFINRWTIEDFFEWDAAMDFDRGVQGDFKQWIQRPRIVEIQQRFPPGTYDTQTVIYKSLGLNEEEVAQNWEPGQINKPEIFDSEEWFLATRYSGSANQTGGDSFGFRLAFSSRRTTQVAFYHVPVRVISINGIDPIKDIEAIYDGSYAFSRKIHLLTRENPSQSVSNIVDYFKSLDGKQNLTAIGYLLPP